MHVRVALATQAQAEGIARVPLRPHEIETGARAVMQSARDATAALMRAGLIAAPGARRPIRGSP